jgi:hypothetical protein
MLHPDWKKILTKAWSQRLNALAFVLTVLEVIFAVYGAPAFIPLGTFAVLSGLTTAGAFVARLYAQKEFKDAD